MPLPKRKSPFVTKVSAAVQNLTKNETYALAHATLKITFLAPPTLSQILVSIGTQPLPHHEPHICETSDQAALPGYWVSPFVATINDLPRWEINHDEYDILLIYCHGGAFSVGHSLMYSVWMNHLITNPKLRVRIYTIEYSLPTRIDHITWYPSQHRALFIAYRKLLEWGIDPRKIVIGGDSSGGFNTLKCFEKLVEEQVPFPGGILLNSPLVDLWVPKNKREEEAHLQPGNSLEKNRKKDYVGPRFLKNGLNLYRPPLDASPIRRGLDWYAEKLPKTYLAYGTGEVLLDSIQNFEKGMRGGKVDLTVYVGKDEAHIFNVLEPKYSRNKQGLEEASQSLVSWLSRVSSAV